MLLQKVTKHLNQLQEKKYRKEFHEFIVEGLKGVSEALHSDAEVVLVVVDGSLREENNIKKIIKYCEAEDISIELCGRKDIGNIKTTDTFPGVLAVIAQPEAYLEDIADGTIICLDGVKDPGNMGTIIRTADWFGIKNLLISEDSVDIYNSKVVRSTMGSIFHADVFKTNDLKNSLQTLKREYSYEIIALDTHGIDISKIKHKKNAVYMFGSESQGLRAELDSLIDRRYTIPGRGNAESLNVAVAAGIVLNLL